MTLERLPKLRQEGLRELKHRLRDVRVIEKFFAEIVDNIERGGEVKRKHPKNPSIPPVPAAKNEELLARWRELRPLVGLLIQWIKGDAPPILPGYVPNPGTPSPADIEKLEKDHKKYEGWDKEDATKYERDFCDDAQMVFREDVAWILQRLLKSAYPRAELGAERALDLLAFESRKPDHCIPRDTAGMASDRHFPLQHCWQNFWYEGPTEKA
jgi:hypothetical protein